MNLPSSGPDDGYFELESTFDGPIPESALPPEARSGVHDIPDAGRPKSKHPKRPKHLKPLKKRKAAPAPLKGSPPKPLKNLAPPKSPDDWKRVLTRTPRGALAASHANAVTIFRNDPFWKEALAYDAFAGRVMRLRSIRWPRFDRPNRQYCKPGPWTDLDTALTRNWLERAYELQMRATDVASAVDVYARCNVVNGPRDYLQTVVWDGSPRLGSKTQASWLTTYGGAADTPVNRAVGVMWLLSAVARAFWPGCQVDHSIVLEGDQGIGKSSLLRTLCPDPAWFLIDIGSEFGKLDSFQKLRGKWLVEMSELDSLGRSALAGAKAFMTSPVDTYRKSFGREAEDHPRRCVFAGTTNKEEYLTDETGNRRFWPVLLTRINLRTLKRDRDQLWAEAVARCRIGEPWHITDPDLLTLVKREQEKRVQTDPWERLVAEHLTSTDVQRAGVTALEVLLEVVKMKPADISRVDEARVAATIKKLGWVHPEGNRKRVGKHRVRRYFPPV
jgi:putative DNA primase/helicase